MNLHPYHRHSGDRQPAVLSRAGIGALFLLSGCAGQYVPPFSVTAGFFGASVTVAEPGYTVPAKVVPTAAVVTPTLMVPAGDPVAGGNVPITTETGSTTTVPAVVAPVSVPVLAVPAK